jgi:hypothetical protein
MKTCKAFIITVTLILVAMGMLPGAQTALSAMADGWNDTTSMAPGRVYLHDLDYSHDTILGAGTLSFPMPSNRPASSLKYSINDGDNSNEAGPDLFQALYVVWDLNPYSTVTFCSANDPVTPNAPIPASALMLFTGLIGIIGFRRRVCDA